MCRECDNIYMNLTEECEGCRESIAPEERHYAYNPKTGRKIQFCVDCFKVMERLIEQFEVTFQYI